jgi:DNA-binding CsgD family transcriptional regulator
MAHLCYGGAGSDQHNLHYAIHANIAYTSEQRAMPLAGSREEFAPLGMYKPKIHSDSRNKEIALIRIKRLASSGLPLEPFVRGVFEVVKEAIPQSPNRIFHIGGDSADTYICNSLELNRVVPLHKRYYVESPPQDAGVKYRVNPAMLLKAFPARTVWMHEEITLPNLYRTEGFNTVFRPWGFHHCMMVTFQEAGEYVGCYPIWREIDQPRFGSEDARFMEAISPHVSHGLRAAHRMSRFCQSESTDFSPVPGWGSGVLLTDPRGSLIAIDSSALLTFQQLAAMDGMNVNVFDVHPIREGLDYVTRTLRAIFHESQRGFSQTSTPVYRLYSHWTGIILNLRGVRMTGLNGQEYFTVLVERGETLDARRRRVLAKWGLSPREAEVLSLLAQGKTGPEMATLMSISHDTARKHMARIFEKLGVENRTAAATVALEAAVSLRHSAAIQ